MPYVKTNEVVTDAMEDIVVQADEAPIEQSEGRTAMRALNDMMLAWDALGIALGFTQVSDLGDDITVPCTDYYCTFYADGKWHWEPCWGNYSCVSSSYETSIYQNNLNLPYNQFGLIINHNFHASSCEPPAPS